MALDKDWTPEELDKFQTSAAASELGAMTYINSSRLPGISHEQAEFVSTQTVDPKTEQPFAKLPTDAQARKEMPIYRGLLMYFPDACAEVAHVSLIGNQQHNPGQPMHWAREKSTDQEDCLVRHLIDAGTRDTDGLRHSAKVAWRALALLQLEIEADRAPKK